MGDLIVLADRLADRSRPSRRRPVVFFFDLASPFSYLAAEDVERLLGEVEWIPVSGTSDPVAELLDEAEAQALDLRLPLVWPEEAPLAFPAATRAAAYAATIGRAAPFALAAGRLAFCGGFDLDDPEILGEAAAAAGIAPEECLYAARDPFWDTQPQTTAQGLSSRGVSGAPAVRVGPNWFEGKHAVAGAATLLRTVGADFRAFA